MIIECCYTSATQVIRIYATSWWDRQTDRRIDSQTDIQTDALTDRQTDTLTDRETDRQTDKHIKRQTDRQKHKKTDRRADSERQTDRQTGQGGRTDTEIEREREWQRNRQIFVCVWEYIHKRGGADLWYYWILLIINKKNLERKQNKLHYNRIK